MAADRTNTQPPGNRTGFSHPKCYAGGDHNCSEKISREHYDSATVLKQIEFEKTVNIAGLLRWQARKPLTKSRSPT